MKFCIICSLSSELEVIISENKDVNLEHQKELFEKGGYTVHNIFEFDTLKIYL